MTEYLLIACSLAVLVIYAIPILRYQLEQDRSFYFLPARYKIHIEAVLFLLIFVVYRLTRLMPFNRAYSLGIMALLLLAWTAFARRVVYRLSWRPLWVRHFEREHPDYSAIQSEGQRQLAANPRLFKKITHAADGFDVWLVTVTRSEPATQYHASDSRPISMWFEMPVIAVVFGVLLWDAYALLLSNVFWLLPTALALIIFVYATLFYSSLAGIVQIQLGLWAFLYLLAVNVVVSLDPGLICLGLAILIGFIVQLVALGSLKNMGNLDRVFCLAALLGFATEMMRLYWLFRIIAESL